MKGIEFFGKTQVTISDALFNSENVKYVNIFHKTSAAFTHSPETEGEITFATKDVEGKKKFKGTNIMDVISQMAKFLESL